MAGTLCFRFSIPTRIQTDTHLPYTHLLYPFHPLYSPLSPHLTLLLPPDLSTPQLLPPGLAQSLQKASQLPLLSPAAKKEKQGREENQTSGAPRKAIWVILFKRLGVVAAIYTGKERKKSDLISIPTRLKEMKLNKLRIRKELH